METYDGVMVSSLYLLQFLFVCRLYPTVVRLGETDITLDYESQHTDFKVKKMIKHPEYVPPSKYNDIGILELDRDVVFNGTIRPACVYTENDDPEGNVTAAGWGRADLRKSGSVS